MLAGIGPAYAGQDDESPQPSSYQPRRYGHRACEPPSAHLDLVAGDHAYLAVGRYLYRSVALNVPIPWGDFTVGAGKTITRIVYYRAIFSFAAAPAWTSSALPPRWPLTTFPRRTEKQAGSGTPAGWSTATPRRATKRS